MSGIEKIYGTNAQWYELFVFLAKNRPAYVKFLYNPFGFLNEPRPIASFPHYADRWLYKNCPLKWVKQRIKFQYNGAPE